MPTKFNHCGHFNEKLMMVILGQTNCGKSHLLFIMLTTDNILDYNNLVIFTSTPNQIYYQLLKEGFENKLTKKEILYLFNEHFVEHDHDISMIPKIVADFSDICETSIRPQEITFSLLTGEKKSKPDDMDKKKKNLIIFDDCVNDKDQTMQRDYFTKGRHNSCSCIYLTQSFYDMNARCIRLNTNLFILFHLTKRTLSQITQDVDVGNEWEFKKLIRQQFQNPRDHKYILVNIEAPLASRLVTDIFS
jgi:hypothetical protein